MPRSVLAGVVIDTCIQLDCNDPIHLTAAVARLLKVTATTPKLERFVQETCHIVLRYVVVA